ncbi:hypothetical protein HYU21_00295, partial [Candidatus Woesearchaeota archaeon]|nr:hypothetical protein [Candidatus Woesearchaeota archaeon]
MKLLTTLVTAALLSLGACDRDVNVPTMTTRPKQPVISYEMPVKYKNIISPEEVVRQEENTDNKNYNNDDKKNDDNYNSETSEDGSYLKGPSVLNVGQVGYFSLINKAGLVDKIPEPPASTLDSYDRGKWLVSDGSKVEFLDDEDNNQNTFQMNEDSTKNLDMIYAQIEQHFDSKSLRVSEHVRAKIESMAGIIFMGSRARNGYYEGKLSFQADLYAQFGIRVDQSSASGKYDVIYRAGVQLSPGIRDVRDNYAIQAPVPVINHFFLTAEGRYLLSQSAAGRAYLVASTMVLVDELGLRGRVQGGIQTGRVKILANMEGRLT